MRANSCFFLGLAFAIVSMASCKKETETFTAGPLSDYVPMQPGKYIIYRLDSTVFTNFQRNVEIHSYQEKHVFDTALLDNNGKPAYRVFRFIRDTAGTTPWISSGSYLISNLTSTVEVNENNMRLVKLTLPIAVENSWKGNRYLVAEPYNAIFNFSNDDNMDDWDFTYSGVGEIFVQKNGQPLQDVITVSQVNESINVPISNPSAYASINYAVDRYAKGIGLVYQELTMWEYQPNPGGQSPYRIGFGIKRSMIDHN